MCYSAKGFWKVKSAASQKAINAIFVVSRYEASLLNKGIDNHWSFGSDCQGKTTVSVTLQLSIQTHYFHLLLLQVTEAYRVHKSPSRHD